MHVAVSSAHWTRTPLSAVSANRKCAQYIWPYAILDRRNLLHSPSAGADVVTNSSGSPSCLPTLLPPSASASCLPHTREVPSRRHHPYLILAARADVEDARGAWRLGKHGVGILFAVNSLMAGAHGEKTTRLSGPTPIRARVRAGQSHTTPIFRDAVTPRRLRWERKQETRSPRRP
ncbi:hypothetical protein C8J57DRAFT_172778 [Mycena rebaudengoi]|nr:hypothetical protein C8J57DRAFT_172778 [Mycena rebaudengoi]